MADTPHVEFAPDIDEMEFERARRGYERMMTEIEANMIGKWFGMPPDKEPPRYAYSRAGLKGRPGTIEREAILRAYGWRPAPPGTRCGGFLMDGDNGSYWYAPMDIVHKMNETRDAARARRYGNNMKAALKRPQNEFYSGEDGEQLAKHGVEIGIAGVETGTATFDEVAESERQARARLARRKPS